MAPLSPAAAASGFGGLDNALLLYEPGDRKGRSALRHSSFNGYLRGALSVLGGGEVRLATMDHASSGLSADLVWLGSGATLSGWATTTARRGLALTGGGPKRLRTAARLVCDLGCKGAWAGEGPVWLSEGSALVNRGRLAPAAS